MAWILLITAGLLETGFAVLLAASEGFTKPVPTVLFAVCAIGSFALLNLALRELPVGTAYAVWTGVGAVGTAVVGMLVLNESRDWVRLACIGLIVLGVVGLKAFTKEGGAPFANKSVSRPAE